MTRSLSRQFSTLTTLGSTRGTKSDGRTGTTRDSRKMSETKMKSQQRARISANTCATSPSHPENRVAGAFFVRKSRMAKSLARALCEKKRDHRTEAGTGKSAQAKSRHAEIAATKSHQVDDGIEIEIEIARGHIRKRNRKSSRRERGKKKKIVPAETGREEKNRPRTRGGGRKKTSRTHPGRTCGRSCSWPRAVPPPRRGQTT